MGKSFGENFAFSPNIFSHGKNAKFSYFFVNVFRDKNKFLQKNHKFRENCENFRIFFSRNSAQFSFPFAKFIFAKYAKFLKKVSKVRKKIFAKFRIFRKSFRLLESLAVTLQAARCSTVYPYNFDLQDLQRKHGISIIFPQKIDYFQMEFLRVTMIS